MGPLQSLRSPKCHDAVFKFIRNKMHFYNYSSISLKKWNAEDLCKIQNLAEILSNFFCFLYESCFSFWGLLESNTRRFVKLFGKFSPLCGVRYLSFDWKSGNLFALIFSGLVLHVTIPSGGPAIKWGWDSPAYTSWYPRFIARPGCPLSQPLAGPGVSPALAQHSA